MSRYRLQPTAEQERRLLRHCAHARFVWNLAVEQGQHWKPGRRSAPGFAEQCRQLTEAREACAWLAAGSVIVQQQALQDHAQAMANYFGGTHKKPTWRKAGRDEGFRIVAVKADTSQTCSACGHHAAESRESQALFRCVARKVRVNADVNAARNIAVGQPVTARGRLPLGGRKNREPQLIAS